jgi:hypothetical protein
LRQASARFVTIFDLSPKIEGDFHKLLNLDRYIWLYASHTPSLGVTGQTAEVKTRTGLEK